ncbi:MAG: DNA polymerase IV, partial [Candidatus Thorarchaeota archaeon]
VASDYQKPDGLTVVRPDEARRFLSPLPVRRLLWVGRKTEEKLNALGIRTIGDLASCDPSLLRAKFGVAGRHIYRMAHGIDNSEVRERHSRKSISKNRTFEQDTSDFNRVLDTVERLTSRVHERLARRSLSFKTVSVRVRYENFETHSHSKTLNFKTSNLDELSKTARNLMEDYLHNGRKVRLVGVEVSNLSAAERQETLA